MIGVGIALQITEGHKGSQDGGGNSCIFDRRAGEYRALSKQDG